jgi:hypothetical protein
MEKNLKILTLAAAASLTGSLIAEDVDVDTYGGYAILSGIEKTYTQTAATKLSFEGGQLTFVLRDGYATLASCLFDPSYVPIPAQVDCSLGSTGFVAAGDYDGDGYPDPLQYFSFSAVANAQLFQPSYPDKLSLIAAPPSKLKRPLSVFGDYSIQVFYNTNDTNNLNPYNITRYRGVAGANNEDNALRQYSASQEDLCQKELVQGVYIYALPRYGYPDISLNARFTQYPMLEAYSTKYKQRAGLRLSNVLWNTDGKALIDPRIVKNLKWVGPTVVNTVATDESYISLLTNDTEDVSTYREYPGNGSRANTLSPFLTSYDLAPGFFIPGDQGVLTLEYQRSLDEGLFTDRSSRKINANFKMVDTYDGFVTSKILTAGLATSAKVATASDDTDKDGISNGLEYATQGVTEEGLASIVRQNFVSLYAPFYATYAGVDITTAENLLNSLSSTTDHPRFYSLYAYNGGVKPYTGAVSGDPLTTPVPEKALTKASMPEIVGPYLDADNHVVLDVPVRPLMDDATCTFSLQSLSGFKKGKASYKNISLKGKYDLTEFDSSTITTSRKLVVWWYESDTDGYYGVDDSTSGSWGTTWNVLFRPTVVIPYTVHYKRYRSTTVYTGTAPLVTWQQYWTRLNDSDPTNDPVSAADCPIIGVAATLKSH